MYICVLAVCLCLAAVARGAGPPNVVILLADDLQATVFDGPEAAVVRTPHIDRLASRGVYLANCINQGSPHGAVCIPSRAMLLTGRHLWRRGGDACEGRPLLGAAFAAHGYDTFVTGKWHNGRAALDRGFQNIGPTGPGMYHSTPRGGAAYDRPAPGNTWRPDDETGAGHWLDVDGRPVHSSERWADHAIDVLEARAQQAENPFLLYVAFHAPHDPRQAPRAYLDMYPPEALPLPPSALPTPPFDPGTLSIRDERLAPFPRTRAALRTHLSEYYAIVSHLDAQVGRILDALERLDLDERTIVVFTSDHGLAMGRHGLLGKQNLYEHSVRTPFIVAGPGIPRGAMRSSLTYLHSLFPTVCELTGVPAPDDLDAPSLVPVLEDDDAVVHATLYGAYGTLQRMSRDERFKLILYPTVRQVQLFDLQTDPEERVNRAGRPDARPVIERLHADLLRWMDATDDPLDRALLADPWTWTATSAAFGRLGE